MAPSPTRSRGSRARPRATTSTSCARRRGCNPIESRHALPVLAPLGLSSFRSTPRAPPPALRTPPRDHPKTTRTTRASSPVRSPARESPRRRAPTPPSRAPCSPRPRRRRRAPAPPPPPRISPSASPPPSRSAPTIKKQPPNHPRAERRSTSRAPVESHPGDPGDGMTVPGSPGFPGRSSFQPSGAATRTLAPGANASTHRPQLANGDRTSTSSVAETVNAPSAAAGDLAHASPR